MIGRNLTTATWHELETNGKFDKNAKEWAVDIAAANNKNQINQKCQEIPHAGNILEISGIGENTLLRNT